MNVAKNSKLFTISQQSSLPVTVDFEWKLKIIQSNPKGRGAVYGVVCQGKQDVGTGEKDDQIQTSEGSDKSV